MDTEKIIAKIKKILELSRNNPSKEEAKAAALKAQRLMAEYHLSESNIDGVKDIKRIMEKPVNVGTGNKWKYGLADIISKNFRCKRFWEEKEVIYFYGYKEDAEVAAMTFKFLFDMGSKLATQYYQNKRNQAKKSRIQFNGKGLKNAFLMGYVDGIKEVLDRQCTALMIVTPKKVEEAYVERSKDFTIFNPKITYKIGNEGEKAREEGRIAGRNTMDSRIV